MILSYSILFPFTFHEISCSLITYPTPHVTCLVCFCCLIVHQGFVRPCRVASIFVMYSFSYLWTWVYLFICITPKDWKVGWVPDIIHTYMWTPNCEAYMFESWFIHSSLTPSIECVYKLNHLLPCVTLLLTSIGHTSVMYGVFTYANKLIQSCRKIKKTFLEWGHNFLVSPPSWEDSSRSDQLCDKTHLDTTRLSMAIHHCKSAKKTFPSNNN